MIALNVTYQCRPGNGTPFTCLPTEAMKCSSWRNGRMTARSTYTACSRTTQSWPR